MSTPTLGSVQIFTHEDATDFLGDKHFRKLAHNTYIERDEDNVITITYHRTPIVKYFPSGTVEIKTNGWRTATTKRRLNLFSPISVWQRNHIWYYCDPFVDTEAFEFPLAEPLILKGY